MKPGFLSSSRSVEMSLLRGLRESPPKNMNVITARVGQFNPQITQIFADLKTLFERT
jgi:hypothetical protein